jgi:hypothetical protein
MVVLRRTVPLANQPHAPQVGENVGNEGDNDAANHIDYIERLGHRGGVAGADDDGVWIRAEDLPNAAAVETGITLLRRHVKIVELADNRHHTASGGFALYNTAILFCWVALELGASISETAIGSDWLAAGLRFFEVQGEFVAKFTMLVAYLLCMLKRSDSLNGIGLIAKRHGDLAHLYTFGPLTRANTRAHQICTAAITVWALVPLPRAAVFLSCMVALLYAEHIVRRATVAATDSGAPHSDSMRFVCDARKKMPFYAHNGVAEHFFDIN